MKRFIIPLIALAIIALAFVSSITKKSVEPATLSELKEHFAKKEKPSADHSKFTQLQKKFTKPQDVTAECIQCHTERHTEVMNSSHWNWEREEYIEGRGIRYIGKKNILNNFCIGINTNEQSCNKCHIGYGWGDKNFDFTNANNVDCLACHDNSYAYVKKSSGAGMPDPSVDLSFVAQRVGRPTKANCGTCHFFGGGGNNVKHGDLEKALFDTHRDVDVHMATDGVNLECVDCHKTDKHQMLGKVYSLSSMNRNRSTCEQCHTETPHENDVINEHTLKVACQTCHIPEYAKVNSTKLEWDWSTAGKLENGKPIETHDSLGNIAYASIKGTFTWGRNVKPEYVWFNGTASHYLTGDTISADSPIRMNTLHGSYDDPDAKIIPVKIHRAKQPYDPVNKMIVQPKTFSTQQGDGGYWNDFDWNRSISLGMQYINLPYSGQYAFAKTEMYWPVNHMVSPKENVVSCNECHTRENSRIGNLQDFYMPGRNYNSSVETLGGLAIVFSLLGVGIHAGFRIAAAK
ncbi:MAG: tetrathionate reductase family octaheme c-type cytochrome, partial [Ignavibacteriales bacterium]|nr:tetrathionate reductase family octaheme c-type cytochrome [Ignavibacteriales bacterium]